MLFLRMEGWKMKTRRFFLFFFVAVMLIAGSAMSVRAQRWTIEGAFADTFQYAAKPYRSDTQLAPSTDTIESVSSGVTVLITDQGLNPSQMTIQVGQAVTWVNQTNTTLSLVSGQQSEDGPYRVYLPLVLRYDGSDDPTAAAGMTGQAGASTTSWGGDIPAGGSYTHTFTEIGDYPYFIANHSDWTGRVVVQPASTDVPTGLPGNEPVAAVVNPRNPANVAVANFARLQLSTDFGQNFGPAILSPIPAALVGTIRRNADDVLAFDSQGNLYWAYLLWVDVNNDGTRDDLTVVVAQINPTTGAVVSVVDVTPGNSVDDKPWIAADANPVSPFADNVYVVWTRNPTLGGGTVLFSRSQNQGATWSAPSNISAAGEGLPWPSHVAVAPNGDVYASYHANGYQGGAAGRVFVLRDSTGGANLASGVPVQKTQAFTAGQCDLNGNIQGAADPTGAPDVPQAVFWMQGAFAPYVLADPLRPGNIYVICNDDPNNAYGNGDEGDVVFARSTDHGNTWTVSTISHAPAGTLQVFPMGAIDQDGNIAVHWYDNRLGGTNASGNWLLDRFGTVSRDGGLAFSNDFRINDAPFDPDLDAPCRFGCGAGGTPTLRIGEYHGIWAVDGIAYTTWTGNGAVDVDGDGLNDQAIFFDLLSILGAFPDRFEPNESTDFAVVASLGADDTYNQARLSIHSATDVDFFKLMALHTGKLQVEIEFNELINDLNAQALDRFGNVVVTGTMTTLQPGSSLASLAIPVVEGEIYFVEVFDPNAPGAFAPQSTYDLTIINRPAPVPFGLDLVAASDSGMSSSDDLTNLATPTIRLRVDEAVLQGLSFSATNDANLADDPPGFKLQVFRNGTAAGFATPVALQPGVYEFIFPSGTPLVECANFLTARVLIVDSSDDPLVPGTAHVTGSSAESDSLLVTLDTTAPPPPSVPDLLASSDSGASDSDNVTKVNPPAFHGTGEANAKVRIRAGGVAVGQDLIGTDASDGVVGDGLGAWEVTIEPLADGTYDITAEAEDLAGNISAPSGAMVPPLVIDTPDGGGLPQRPTLDLMDSFDTGRSDHDNVTRLTTLDFRVSAEPGTTVVIKDGNTVIDSFVMPAVAFTTRTVVLTEGPHPLSSESTDLAGNTSHQSEELLVTVDTTPPSVTTPDLAVSSDTGGVNNDDVTTIMSPAFVGTEEANALVRIAADGVFVGQGVVGSDLSDGLPGNGMGAYEVTVEPLDDGVYAITAQLEDLAGNLSVPSSPLSVTIANQVLNLSGATADVVVHLDNDQVMGFPGYPSPGSVVGIRGIPVVNLDVNGQALTILGTPVDDTLAFHPTGPQDGSVTREGSAQVLNLTGVGGPFTLDPGSGVDTVTVNGTAIADAVTVTVDTTCTVQVNSLQAVDTPNATTERLAVSSGQGADTIDVTVFDTVNADLYVDAGEPTSIKPVADVLNAIAGSPRGHLQNKPGGPVPGSGSVFVTYPQTTGTTTRIDYAYVERVKLIK
jgi:plastocyanin